MQVKNILIVSDNFNLVKCIQETITGHEYHEFCFRFCYSPLNKEPHALIALGMKKINVKQEVEQILQNYQLVISAHCKQIFPPRLVNNVTCINIHPGLNPFNRGWYPQVFSIINDLPVGATIHLMDEEIDHGSIIISESVSVYSYDTSLDVYNRVLELEKRLIRENFYRLVRGDYQVHKITEEGNYNSIDDFKYLCKLELDHQGTLKEHLDLLRALTHGDFQNAYFLDKKGEKVYVKIVMEKEL